MAGSQLEFGVGHWSMQSSYMYPRAPAYLYREAARQAQLAEQLEFDSFWMGEHHLSYDGYCPSLVPAAAFLASATQRIRLATGVMILPFHPGARVAEASAAADSLAPGRLRLAMGLGYRREEFLAAGHEVRDRVPLFERHMEDLLGPLATRAGRTEIWMGVSSPGAPLKRAARYGRSLVLTPNVTPETLAEYRRAWDSEFCSHDGGPGRIAVVKDIWVDRDRRRLEWIRGRIAEMWRHYALFFVTGSPTDATSGCPRWEVPDVAARDAAAEQAAARTILGTPEQVVDALAPFIEAGVDGIILRVQFGGIGGPELDQCMELLATEVVPGLRCR